MKPNSQCKECVSNHSGRTENAQLAPYVGTRMSLDTRKTHEYSFASTSRVSVSKGKRQIGCIVRNYALMSNEIDTIGSTPGTEYW